MDNNLLIKKFRDINANTEKVWNILTHPDNIERWLGTRTESEWTPNSEILFSFIWNGKEITDKGIILEFEKEKIFSYKYWSAFSGLPDKPENYSVIKFALASTDSGTTLELTHSDFATQTMYEHSDKNWEETLDQIKQLSEE